MPGNNPYRHSTHFMIQIESSINFDLALPLEGHFCELDISPWSLIQKTDNDAYQLFGFFNTEKDAIKSWSDLKELFPTLPANPEVKSIIDEDWQNAYKKYLKPWNYKDLHWIPIWEKENTIIPKGNVAVFFDAGMAFGTGAHETTQLCAQRLIDYRDAHKANLNQLKVIDAGCGSGILTISASLLGFGNVLGFDIDPDAVTISKENALFNNINNHIDNTPNYLAFKTAGLEAIFPKEKADLILANILANVLCQYSDILLKAINPQGTLVLSGILVDEVQKVKEHFSHAAASIWKDYNINCRQLGEWADLRFDRS